VYVYVNVGLPLRSLIVPVRLCVDWIRSAVRSNISAIWVHSARIVSPSVFDVTMLKTNRVAITEPPDLIDLHGAFAEPQHAALDHSAGGLAGSRERDRRRADLGRCASQ
jgi:hypothetical protein